jgi:hypothetical protein
MKKGGGIDRGDLPPAALTSEISASWLWAIRQCRHVSAAPQSKQFYCTETTVRFGKNTSATLSDWIHGHLCNCQRPWDRADCSQLAPTLRQRKPCNRYSYRIGFVLLRSRHTLPVTFLPGCSFDLSGTGRFPSLRPRSGPFWIRPGRLSPCRPQAGIRFGRPYDISARRPASHLPC